jgi:hypothetical protein
LKKEYWLPLAAIVGIVGYVFFKNRTPEPPKMTNPSAIVESIRYVNKKDGTELRIVSLVGVSGCVQGELSDGASVAVMQSYDYSRVGRDMTLFDERGAPAGNVRIKYEALSCDSDIKKDSSADDYEQSDQ